MNNPHPAPLIAKMHRAALFLLVLVAAFLVAASANAEELRGRVVGIVDGDTLDLLTADKKTVRLRPVSYTHLTLPTSDLV